MGTIQNCSPAVRSSHSSAPSPVAVGVVCEAARAVLPSKTVHRSGVAAKIPKNSLGLLPVASPGRGHRAGRLLCRVGDLGVAQRYVVELGRCPSIQDSSPSRGCSSTSSLRYGSAPITGPTPLSVTPEVSTPWEWLRSHSAKASFTIDSEPFHVSPPLSHVIVLPRSSPSCRSVSVASVEALGPRHDPPDTSGPK